MISVPSSLLITADKLGTKGNSGLLSGFDVSGNSPSDEGRMVKVDFTDIHAIPNKQFDGFIFDRFPLPKSLFEEKRIQSECSDCVILVSPISDNEYREAGFTTH